MNAALNKFRNTTLLFISLILVLFGRISSAEEGDAVFDSLARIVVIGTLTHQYAEAESAAVELTRLYPQSAAGWFYRGGIISSMMFDYEQVIREDDFKDYLNRAIDIAEKRLKKNPHHAWSHFYLGGAKGYLALQSYRKGNYFAAWIKGTQALKELRRTLEIDSTIYDANVGLGNYMYWISRNTAFLRWTPFISDKREEGIALMYETVDKGKYSGETAASSLAWVLINAGRYEEALELVEEPLKKYPDSRFFLFANARTLFELGRCEESIELYSRLLESVRNAEYNNHYNEFGILQKLAQCHYELKNYDEAICYAEEAVNLPLTLEIKEEKEGKITLLKSIISRSRKKIAKLEQAIEEEQ